MPRLIAVAFGATVARASDMLWGTATAAYQVEGYRTAEGRQPSIWDAFDTKDVSRSISWKKPDGEFNVYDGENAATVDRDFAMYPDSIRLAKDYGFGAQRLSISWPRVMTFSRVGGKLTWKRNEDGIAHYRKELEAYRQAGVQTAVTMFHWDLPLAIEEYAMEQPCGSAWLCHDLIQGLFAQYADLLLVEYRDVTDWWITINEPLTVVQNGYASPAKHAPGRCGNRTICYHGDDHTEPYLAMKGFVLAHARAFRLWEAHGRPGYGCGMTLNMDWRIAFTDSHADLAAAQRAREWQGPPFADPIFLGHWPASMVERLGDRLPRWTEAEIKLVKGSHDGHFFMNHYTTNFARALPSPGPDCGLPCDPEAETSGYNFTSGEPIGTPSSNGWLFNYGPGLGDLVDWYHDRYGPQVSFVITENGWGNASTTYEAEMGRDDMERCNYYRNYLGNLSAVAARKGISVDAYFAWSLMDNYEWNDGFSVRFGLTYVDFDNGGKRTPKKSALWFKKHVTTLRELPTNGEPFPACEDDEPTPKTSIVHV